METTYISEAQMALVPFKEFRVLLGVLHSLVCMCEEGIMSLWG
jgi:hypothetical protein